MPLRSGRALQMGGRSAMRAAILASSLCVWGCSIAQSVGSFTAADAATAAAIDPPDASCYSAIGSVGSAVSSSTGKVGLLSLAASDIAIGNALQSAGCGSVEAHVLGRVLRATPAAPLVP